MAKRLDITFHFTIKNEDRDKNAPYDLVNYILDCAWDEIYCCGLEPGDYEIKEVEVNASE